MLITVMTVIEVVYGFRELHTSHQSRPLPCLTWYVMYAVPHFSALLWSSRPNVTVYKVRSSLTRSYHPSISLNFISFCKEEIGSTETQCHQVFMSSFCSQKFLNLFNTVLNVKATNIITSSILQKLRNKWSYDITFGLSQSDHIKCLLL